MSNIRADFSGARAVLADRLSEPPPGRIQLLTGPRQVGKTTLLLQLADELESRVVYAAADEPDSALPGWWDRVWGEAEERAASQGRAVLLLDEIQHVPGWSSALKGRWDRVRRGKIPLHVVATGSSALTLGAGARESLAGRFERITLAHWPAAALVRELGEPSASAAESVVRYGSFPGSVALRADPVRWRAYLRDSIVEPAIGKDLLALGVVRKPALLRQLFAVCAGHPAEIVSLQKLRGSLTDRGALETIAHYLRLLEEAYLVVGADKHSTRAVRRRSAPPKLIVLNNGLLAALDPAGPPDPESDPARYGRWVENACLAHAWNAGQEVRYWREEPLEVDGILEGSWGRWAVEVKTGPFTTASLEGLLEFCRRNPKVRPVMLVDSEREGAKAPRGVRVMGWREFLMRGLGGG
jgi:predicted AAA+ superfamily ATPase